MHWTLAGLTSTDDDSMSGTEDEARMARRARSDPDAFAKLYHRYLGPVYRYCRRRLNSPEAAEDATSQVFYKALRSIGQFRGGSFRAWLFRIAFTTVVDNYQRPRPYEIHGGAQLVDTEPTPEQRVLDQESEQNVQALLLELTDDQREVVELRLAGLTGPEIAEATDRTPESIRMLQYRAMNRLRRHLDDGTAEATDGKT